MTIPAQPEGWKTPYHNPFIQRTLPVTHLFEGIYL